MIKAVIVEDSRLARLELKELLKVYEKIEVVGEADSYETALKVINKEAPDLLFLDIHLPGKNGFDILQSLETVPAVLFTTAFDQYALQSFEYNTIDYLLKPISAERLKKAVDKVIQVLKPNDTDKQSQIVKAQGRIFVKENDKCWFVTITDISLIESKGNYAQIYFQKNRSLILRSLQQMESILDPNVFIRANRQQIVNINFVDQVVKWFGGKLKITMKSGQVVEVSRRQASHINDLFGM